MSTRTHAHETGSETEAPGSKLFARDSVYTVSVEKSKIRDQRGWHKPLPSSKKCLRCGTTKAISEFPIKRYPTGTPAVQSYCKPCFQQYKRDKRSPETTRAMRRSHSHNRRVKLTSKGSSYTPQQWFDLCTQYGNKCLCCGNITPLTVDHILPVSLGGSNNIGNIQPLCIACNISKGATYFDYRQGSPQMSLEIVG